MKHAYYFSLDAILGAGLLVMGLILVSTLYVDEPVTSASQHYAQDAINILSTAQLHEYNDPFITQLVNSGQIDNLNKTILEQAAQFWAEGNTSLANNLLNIIQGLVPEGFSIGLFFDKENVYGSNQTPSNILFSSKRLISGVTKGSQVEGFTSQARLANFDARNGVSFYYFGGFVGSGNLTVRLLLPNSVINITKAELELDVNDDFTLLVNDNYAGDFQTTTQPLRADKWTIDDVHLTNFNAGVNEVSLVFSEGLGFVGGGFLKVSYSTSEVNDPVVFFNNISTNRYYFPQIEGVINLFDSFFIPGDLQSMNMHLHYQRNATNNSFLNIGNVSAWSSQATGEQIIDVSNAEFNSRLDYAQLSENTIPVRFGGFEEGGTFIINEGGAADVVLVNDLSGSMEFCFVNGCDATTDPPEPYCGTNHNEQPQTGTYCDWTPENYTLPNYGPVCSSRWHSTCPVDDQRKIDISKNVSILFANLLLSFEGNRLGSVGYTSQFDGVIPPGGSWNDRFAPFPDGIGASHNLSSNVSELIEHINTSWDTHWDTCICCGVRRAREILNLNNTNSTSHKSMIVMSDGEATDRCGAGTGSGSAKGDAINEAHDACDNYDITVNTVAFGDDADTETLQAMVCNGGSFHLAANVSDLLATYDRLIEQIINVTFIGQLINVTGLPSNEILFGDSYIEYSFIPSIISEFGVIPSTVQTSAFGNNISETTLTLPALIINDVRVTSYSAASWTDNLTISNSIPNRVAFSLPTFSNSYTDVGDPFVVYAPPTLFEPGDNIVHISTGTGPLNYTGGSPDDSIVYTVLVPNSVPEEGVFPKADGCNWQLAFEQGSNFTLPIPQTYSGSEICNFSTATYPQDDAINDAVFRLLSQLDFDNDGLLDVLFTNQAMELGSFTISDVPSLWGPTLVEVRVWQ